MGRCVIQTCSITSSAKATAAKAILHSFPKTLDRIKVWLLSTGHQFKDLELYAGRILQTKTNNNFRICSGHFKPEDYMMKGNVKVFRPDTVPSIFVQIPGKAIINEDVRPRVYKKRRPVIRTPPAVSSSVIQTLPGTVRVKDAATQTDLQYNVCAVPGLDLELSPFELGNFSLEHCRHYIVSSPVKLQQGILSSQANASILRMSFCR